MVTIGEGQFPRIVMGVLILAILLLSSYTIPSKGSTQGTWTVKAEFIYGSQILDVKTVTFQGTNKL